jgi:tRNA 5-methylaminomethyl-2-thiouridine biosynthesis bifunctional protein
MLKGWTALAADGTVLAQAPVVVVAGRLRQPGPAGQHRRARACRLNPLRGQLLYGPMPEPPHPLPPFPVNGLGNFITDVPVDGTPSWVLGSTFERGCREAACCATPTPRKWPPSSPCCCPQAPQALAPQIASGAAPCLGRRALHRARPPARGRRGGCRRALPGLFVSTGMGARGMTLAVLCGELLAAQLEGEPAARAAAPRACAGASAAVAAVLRTPETIAADDHSTMGSGKKQHKLGPDRPALPPPPPRPG